MNNSIMSMQEIHKVFTLEKQNMNIIKGVSLEVEKGDFISICGPSGAGKSTLLNIMGGISKPTFGKVYLNGLDMYNLKDDKLSDLRNKKIGIVFQFYNLLPDFTALENILLPARIGKIDARERAENLMTDLGLKERMNHRPGELSGGEQQRVALARALINNPDILLADEPTGNLDKENSNLLFELMHSINQKMNQTMVIITHDEHLAAKTKKIIQMIDGEIKD